MFVTGSANDPSQINSYTTFAYDGSSGAELWEEFYGGSGNAAHGRAIGVRLDGTRVYVTGFALHTQPTDENNNYATLAYDSGFLAGGFDDAR